MRRVAAVLPLLFVATLAMAAEPPAPVHAVRVSDPIVVDGILDEAVWKSDNAVTGLTQADPQQGSAPTQRTEHPLLEQHRVDGLGDVVVGPDQQRLLHRLA